MFQILIHILTADDFWVGIYQQITTLLRRSFTTHLPCEGTGDEDLDNRFKSGKKTKTGEKNMKKLENFVYENNVPFQIDWCNEQFIIW